MQKFVGTGVALITPFIKGMVDFDAYAKVQSYVSRNGVDYLVPLGSTGESATLSDQECRAILDQVIKKNRKKLPIVAGNFGGKNTNELIAKIKNFDFTGIDAILSSSPEYSKPSQKGIFDHYMAIAKASPVPVILYNVPGRTNSNIEWQTTIALANASDNIIAIKEASGDIIQATNILKNKPKDFKLISGDDEIALAMIAIGGQGVISVIANVFPEQFSKMISLALANDFEKARKINFDTYDLHHYLYKEGNPVGIKSAMHICEFCTNEVRLPLSKMDSKNFNRLKELMGKLAFKPRF